MSKHSTQHLNETVRHGFHKERGKAWHLANIDTDVALAKGYIFDGAVPLDAVSALLNWIPETHEVHTVNPTTGVRTRTDKQAIVHPATQTLLGIHSERYGHLNGYSDLLKLAMLLTDGGADVYSCGIPGWGEIGWVQVVPRAESVKLGSAAMRPDLIIGSSLDGSMKLRCRGTSINTICDNTFRASFADSDNEYRVKHTRNAVFDLDQARRALDLSIIGTRKFVAMFERLANLPATDAAFEQFLQRIFPMPVELEKLVVSGRLPDGAAASLAAPVQATITRALNKRADVRSIYHNDERTRDFRGSLAGVWQAFNTWQTWDAPTRGGKDRIERKMLTALSDVGSSDDAVLQALGVAVDDAGEVALLAA